MAALCPELPPRGFSFENCKRNVQLASQGYTPPKATKTGTTIVGIVYKDGVILGADTRATSGNIVADKNCEKLHYISKKIYTAGAGTAADCDHVTKMVESQLALHELNTGRQPRVATVVRILKQHLYRYQGHIGCALIVGGMDVTGPHLYSIAPHGSSDKLPYVTMGSGSLAAVAVLESNWKPEMDLEAGKKLVRDAIAAGIMNDMGSGSTCGLVVLSAGATDYIRHYDVVCKKGEREGVYSFPKGTTPVIETKVIPYDVESNEIRLVGDEAMDM